MSTFHYQRQVFFKDTDLAGIVYFANFYNFAHEAFETYLKSAGVDLPGLIAKRQELWPITFSDCKYLAPVRLNDVVAVDLSLEQKNVNSIRYQCDLSVVGAEKLAAIVHIEHTFVSASDWHKIPVPAAILALMSR